MYNLEPCAWKNYLRVVAQPPEVGDSARVGGKHQGCDVHLLVPNDHERSEKLDVFHWTLGRKHQTMVDFPVKLEAHMQLIFFTEVTGVQLNFGFGNKRIDVAQYQQSEGADITRASQTNVSFP